MNTNIKNSAKTWENLTEFARAKWMTKTNIYDKGSVLSLLQVSIVQNNREQESNDNDTTDSLEPNIFWFLTWVPDIFLLYWLFGWVSNYAAQ